MPATVKGLKKATEAVSAVGPKFRRAVAAAVRSEAETILADAKVLVPYATGNLHDSHRITVRERPAIFAIIEFLAPYALYVHEFHGNYPPRSEAQRRAMFAALRGRTPRPSNGVAKYLEIPLKEASSGYAARVAARARRLLGEG